MLEKFKATHARGTGGVELTTVDSDGMDQALEAKNTLHSTPWSPVSNINRMRPASPLQTGLVQPWVQSEGSCLTSATPFNVRLIFFRILLSVLPGLKSQ